MAENSTCTTPSLEPYDTSQQIGGLFAVFITSLFGACIPLLVRKVFKSDDAFKALGIFKMFGTGVLISTALIHMLIPSVELLANECLPPIFTGYTGWAGAITMAGVLVGNTIQIVSRYIVHPSSSIHLDSSIEDDAFHSGHALGVTKSYKELTIGVYVLEASIFIHSIIVGLALGTSSSSNYIPLLIAICFHQLFEGMAISSLVAELFHKDLPKTIMMALLYAISTPLGIFLGIMIYSGYNPESFSALVSQGIIESFAAGLLLYDAIANLLVPYFSSSFFKHSVKFQIGAIASLWLGAIVMAIIGIWA